MARRWQETRMPWQDRRSGQLTLSASCHPRLACFRRSSGLTLGSYLLLMQPDEFRSLGGIVLARQWPHVASKMLVSKANDTRRDHVAVQRSRCCHRARWPRVAIDALAGSGTLFRYSEAKTLPETFRHSDATSAGRQMTLVSRARARWPQVKMVRWSQPLVPRAVICWAGAEECAACA